MGLAVTAGEAVGPMVRDYAAKDVLGRAGNGEESLFGCRFIDGLLLKAHTLHSRYRTIFALARRPSIVTNTVVYRVGVLLSIGAVVLRRELLGGVIAIGIRGGGRAAHLGRASVRSEFRFRHPGRGGPPGHHSAAGGRRGERPAAGPRPVRHLRLHETTLHANPGGLTGVPWFELDAVARFFSRRPSEARQAGSRR